MQQRNIINGMTTLGIYTLIEFYSKLTPFLFLGIVLIMVDTRFGTAAARKRGEVIRISRKWRRAINKFVDYFCWVTLSGLFDLTYGTLFKIPLLSALMLLIIYSIEIASCFDNYFESRGIKKKVNIFKLFKKTKIDEFLEDKDDDNTRQRTRNGDPRKKVSDLE